MIDWAQWALTVVGVTGIIAPILWGVTQQRKRQHIENQQKFDLLLGEREYLPAHDHIENGDEPLLASGVIRKRRRGDILNGGR